MIRNPVVLQDTECLFSSHSFYSALPEVYRFTSRGWETSVNGLTVKESGRDVCNTWPGAVCAGWGAKGPQF